MNTKKILVTGGAGFIGSHCVDALLARGEKVTVLDIVPEVDAVRLAPVRDRIQYIEGDIRDREVLETIMTEHTHVLHLAAVVSVPISIKDPLRSHDTNVTGTLNVLDAATQHSISRVVYASSAAVYGDTKEIPTPESVPPNPLSPYGLHKLMNEEYAHLYHKLYGLSTCGLRFFNVYGSRQDPTSPYSGVISLFMKRVAAGEDLAVYGDGTATRDFVHVSDIVMACLAALDTNVAAGEVFNVGSGSMVSINELITAVGQATKTTITPQYQAPRTGDILHSGANIDRVKQTFQFAPKTGLVDGLCEIMMDKKQ